MAWITGALADTAVGTLITLFDGALTQNDHWDIFDAAAGTNRKVYRCRRWKSSGESASLSGSAGEYDSFFFDVNDNIGTSYATVGLWENWDAGTHAGIGANVITRYIRKAVGDWAMALNDTRFVLVMWAEGHATYVGLPKLARDDYFMPMICAISANPSTGYYNPLAMAQTYVTDTSCVAICYWNGLTRNIYISGASSSQTQSRAIRTVDGAVVYETSITVAADARFAGWMDGVCACASNQSFANGDKITVDGVDWYIVRDWYAAISVATMCVVKAA